MKAIRIHKHGGPEVLQLDTNVTKPTPGDTQVLIKTSAVGINPVDVYTVSGQYAFKPTLPWIPGWDASGVVEAVGKKVTNLKKGDRVYCAGNVSGGYAEYVVSEERQTGHLGKTLSFAQGASIGVPYYTAYRAIVTKACAKPGETILIHGASGAVGLGAVQISKAMGLRVLGTAGTEKGLELVKANGAVAAFNHRETGYEDKIKAATGGKGVDIILEMLGNANFQRDLGLIVNKGRVVVIGSRGETTINPGTFLYTEATVKGVALPQSTESEWREMTAYLEAGIESGWVKPIVAREYPLAKAGEAQKDIMADKGTLGNLVLMV